MVEWTLTDKKAGSHHDGLLVSLPAFSRPWNSAKLIFEKAFTPHLVNYSSE